VGGGRAANTQTEAVTESREATDASLTSRSAYPEVESSARVLKPVVPEAPPAQVMAAAQVVNAEPPVPFAVPPQREETPNYSSRRWRAEAWERERGREQREGGRRPEIVHRRGGF
jgi:hypothetical protein